MLIRYSGLSGGRFRHGFVCGILHLRGGGARAGDGEAKPQEPLFAEILKLVATGGSGCASAVALQPGMDAEDGEHPRQGTSVESTVYIHRSVR